MPVSATLMQQIGDFLEEWEAYYPYMYLDSVGLVTVGYGAMLATPQAASALPFFHEKTYKPATIPEVEAAFNDLVKGAAQQKGAAPKDKYSARHYKTASDLRIREDFAAKLRDDHVMRDYGQLVQIYPEFDTFPDDAKVALFDMIYNLGAGLSKNKHHKASGLRRYGKMNAAVNAKDWAVAAADCHRNGISKERNAATKQLFLNCVK